MPPQCPDHELVTEWARKPRKQQNSQRLDAIDVQCINVLRIIRIGEARTLGRFQSLILMSAGSKTE
jgi:hypothetical protein